LINVEVSTTIDKPVAEVFAFVQDERNIPRWDPDLLKATKVSDGPIGVGTKFHLQIKPFLGQTEGHGEVVAYEPQRRIELQFAMGALSPHVSHLFEPTASGTRFTRRVEMRPGGFFRLLSPLLAPVIRRRNVNYLATLKQLVESGHTTS
jgi:uncharacterized protein YndB with AHSA1/START domain